MRQYLTVPSMEPNVSHKRSQAHRLIHDQLTQSGILSMFWAGDAANA